MGDLARVFSAVDPVSGDLMKARLEAEGIWVMVKQGGAGHPYPSGPVYLWVRKDAEQRALSVIDAASAGVFEVSDDELEAQAMAAEPEAEPE
jgi:hypothetical protein